MQPAPLSPDALNKFVEGATRHLHGTPLLFQSAAHGTLHFVGGENSALRVWTIAADGSSAYQAGSNEIASAQSPRPPGGMPGWSITLAANNGVDGIVAAMIPYKDSNMTLSPGRFLIYDAQNFAANPDGSKRIQILWTARTGARITPSRTPSSIARSFGTDEYTVPPTMDALMSTGCRLEQD
jgi:hypothetical protein